VIFWSPDTPKMAANSARLGRYSSPCHAILVKLQVVHHIKLKGIPSYLAQMGSF
jgi:hypothetical protein